MLFFIPANFDVEFHWNFHYILENSIFFIPLPGVESREIEE